MSLNVLDAFPGSIQMATIPGHGGVRHVESAQARQCVRSPPRGDRSTGGSSSISSRRKAIDILVERVGSIHLCSELCLFPGYIANLLSRRSSLASRPTVSSSLRFSPVSFRARKYLFPMLNVCSHYRVCYATKLQATQIRAMMLTMESEPGNEDVAILHYDPRVARASLGCLSAGPQSSVDGEWILLLEDDEGNPCVLAYIETLSTWSQLPLARASGALSQAGYEHRQELTPKPWAARWKIIRQEDRLPG